MKSHKKIYTTYSTTNQFKEARSFHCTSLPPHPPPPPLHPAVPKFTTTKLTIEQNASQKPPIVPYIISRAYLMLVIYCDISKAPSHDTFQPKNFPVDCPREQDCTGQPFPRPIQYQAQLVPRRRTLKRKGWRCKRQTVSGLR